MVALASVSVAGGQDHIKRALIISMNWWLSLTKPWLRHWPEGVPQTVVYPEIPLPDLLSTAARKYPCNTATIFFEKSITYRELNDLSNRFAFSLTNLGVKKGDRVALLLPNIPQFLICYYGAMRAGAVVVPCSPLYKERELEFQLNDSKAETIVTLDSLYGVVASVQERTRLQNVITTALLGFATDLPEASTGSKTKDVLPLDTVSLTDLLRANAELPPKIAIDSKRDPALLQYTGGTTGIPKAAILTHHNLVVNAVQFGSWLPAFRDGCEVVLAALPLFHIFGMTVAMNMPILKAETIVLVPKFETRDVLKIIQNHAATFFPGVPTMYIALINDPHTPQFNLQTVRLCISGGAPLPAEVMRKFESLIRGRLVEGYGLTEASPVTHCNPVDRREKVRAGSIGIPLPDTEAKIVDIETGEHDLPADKNGELVVRGPQVMAGYWNQPEETRLVLRHEWLYTGDIAKMDEDGYFYVVDRKKDMINVSGLKVWPREVEEVLYEHPAVKEAAVIGVADPYKGEAVKACLVLKEGFRGRVRAEDVVRFCKDKMAGFKVPTQVEFVYDLPKTPAGKVLRRDLHK
jgi:long-chain acyl-CoA synthetase